MNKSKTDPKTDNKHQRALAALLEQGVAAIGLGAACLVAPSFLEPSSATASVAAVLRMAGWLSAGVGFVLLGFRFSVQSKAKKLLALPRGVPSTAEAPHGRRAIGTEGSLAERGFPIASGPAPTLDAKMQTQADRPLQQ